MSDTDIQALLTDEETLKRVKLLVEYLENSSNNSRFKELPYNHKLLAGYLILNNKTENLNYLNSLIYKYRPPTIDEFLTPDYIGSIAQYYTPDKAWGKFLREVFSPNSSYWEIILSGAIGCVTGDTKIPLLNGEVKEIKDLVGKENFYVYSWDLSTNKVVPGLASNVHCSGKNVEIWEVILDDQTVWRGTWDHPFLLTSGEYVKASKLKSGDLIQSNKDRCVVTSVRNTQEKEDVFDLTVDEFHNFGILDNKNGIFFTHNTGKSFVARIALFYNLHRVNCLSGDTIIPTYNYGDQKLKDLVGKDNVIVYSWDHLNNRFTYGKAFDIRKSKDDAEVYKLTLRTKSGELTSVKATSDHLFLLKSGEYRKLIDLKEGDRLKSLYTDELKSLKCKECGKEVIDLSDSDRLKVFESRSHSKDFCSFKCQCRFNSKKAYHEMSEDKKKSLKTSVSQSLKKFYQTLRDNNSYGIYNKNRLDQSKKTCIDRYGVDHQLKSKRIQSKIKTTNLQKYGVENVFQSDLVKEKFKQVSLDRYGTENPNQSAVVKDKIKATNQKIYKCDYGFQSEEVKNKIKSSMIEKYGIDNALRSTSKFRELSYRTKKLHHTFNSSSVEERFYLGLKKYFKDTDIVRQYRDSRYPFNCDFYIRSLDLFIELNVFWTHGKEKFDSNNENHLKILEDWKSKINISKFYDTAVSVWTKSDPEKLKVAKKNNLNYITLYTWDQCLEFLSTFESNHEVVSIEKLEKTEDVFDLSVETYHNFCIKDTDGSYIVVHNCLREPQITMGTDRISPIYLQFIGLTKAMSQDAMMTPFRNLLKGCKYYIQVKKKEELDEPRDDGKIPWFDKGFQLWFPNNVCIQDGSQLNDALSKDIFSCLPGNTLIPLLDGSIRRLDSLVGSKNFKVFSYDINKKRLVQGNVKSVNLTRKNATLLKVTFDNGGFLRGTPDHKILLQDGHYVELQDLKEGDSIRSLYLNYTSKLGSKEKSNYISFRLNNKKTHNGREFLHRYFARLYSLYKKKNWMYTSLENTLKRLGGLLEFPLENLNDLPNHKVLKIEEEAITEDVYDLEVETYHNFAVFDNTEIDPEESKYHGMIFVHNCEMEEIDFKGTKIGVEPLDLYKAMTGRIKSRFFNKNNFRSRYLLSVIISSVTYDTSPISMYMKDIPVDSPYTKIAKFAHWDVFPSNTDKYFYVQVGTTAHPHKIFDSVEDIEMIDSGKYNLPPSCKLLKVPAKIDYLQSFRNDINWAIQTIAGIATSSSLHPFSDFTKCQDPNLVKECILKSNFSDTEPLWKQLPVSEFATLLDNPIGTQKFKFKRYPNAPRYIARDDAMTHIAGFSVSHKERGRDGRIIGVYDLIVEIITDTQIQMKAVDQLCIDLVELFGLSIRAISLDTYQSVSSQQFLKNYFKYNQTVDIRTISVDRNIQGYALLSGSILENQIRWGSSPRLETMLGGIYYSDNKPYATKEIMDGRKDSCDAVCRNAVAMFLNHLEDEPVNIYENYELFKDKSNMENTLKTLGFKKVTD